MKLSFAPRVTREGDYIGHNGPISKSSTNNVTRGYFGIQQLYAVTLYNQLLDRFTPKLFISPNHGSMAIATLPQAISQSL